MHNRIRETIKEANASGVALLFTDLELASTMLRRAELAGDDKTKRRNIAHAAKACQSTRHFMKKLKISARDERSLNGKLETLEARMRTLQPRSG